MLRQAAFTLIELLVTIVVIGVAAAALMGVFTSTIAGSADPVIQQQATTIAEAYVEEITLRAFNDPQGGESCSTEGETRPAFDDIWDYNNLGTTQVRDQNNVPIGALGAYSVVVTVSADALGTIPSAPCPGANAARIDATVDHPVISPIVVSAYRTNY